MRLNLLYMDAFLSHITRLLFSKPAERRLRFTCQIRVMGTNIAVSTGLCLSCLHDRKSKDDSSEKGIMTPSSMLHLIWLQQLPVEPRLSSDCTQIILCVCVPPGVHSSCGAENAEVHCARGSRHTR